MRHIHRIRGVGLIEVLVALVIIAVGLLGLLSLEGSANHAEMESYQRAQALILVKDMVNRMKANPQFVGCYVLANTPYSYLGTGVNFTNTNCNAISDADMAAWNKLLNGAAETTSSGATTTNVGAMIGARGCISAVAGTSNQYQVEVAWQGLSNTKAPPSSATCGTGLYGADTMRRDVAYQFQEN